MILCSETVVILISLSHWTNTNVLYTMPMLITPTTSQDTSQERDGPYCQRSWGSFPFFTKFSADDFFGSASQRPTPSASSLDWTPLGSWLRLTPDATPFLQSPQQPLPWSSDVTCTELRTHHRWLPVSVSASSERHQRCLITLISAEPGVVEGTELDWQITLKNDHLDVR